MKKSEGATALATKAVNELERMRTYCFRFLISSRASGVLSPPTENARGVGTRLLEYRFLVILSGALTQRQRFGDVADKTAQKLLVHTKPVQCVNIDVRMGQGRNKTFFKAIGPHTRASLRNLCKKGLIFKRKLKQF